MHMPNSENPIKKDTLFGLKNNSTACFRSFFLLDCVGALLTALMLALVLARFEPLFGMPSKVLYILAAVACAFATYSGFCYFFVARNWKPYLQLIALANLAYCLATFGLVLHYRHTLSALGWVYFGVEITVIGLLVHRELICASGADKNSGFR